MSENIDNECHMGKEEAEKVFKKLIEISTCARAYLLSLPIELLCEAIYEQTRKHTTEKNFCLLIKEGMAAIVKDIELFDKQDGTEIKFVRH